MKRLVSILLALLLVPAGALAAFSESSAAFDPALAQEALQIAEMCYAPPMQASLLEASGYRCLGAFNYERPEGDTRHIAAYTLYDRAGEDGRTEVVIAVRGTGEGEWPLNMELMPSGDYSLPYAENFYLAARDILETNAAYLDSLADPAFLVTGHSRGAAVANLLGAELTERYGAENVFVYTFATPRTVREGGEAYGNIFNVINPADIVTYLPFPQWGFGRNGADILLPVDDAALLPAAQAAYEARGDKTGDYAAPLGGSAATQTLVEALAALMPEPSQGYDIRHALAHTGEAVPDEEGLTAGEFLLLLMEGGLLSTGSSAQLAQVYQAENDFTPVLVAMASTLDASGTSALGAAHMPAMYGAWLTAAFGQ